MLNNVSTDTTIIGLIFFFAVFLSIAIWVYRPSKKKQMEDFANIPLNESKDKE